MPASIFFVGPLPFDTGSGVIANFYPGADPMTDGSFSNPYTAYTIDLTPLITLGGTYDNSTALTTTFGPASPGTIISFGNNRIKGNGTDGTPNTTYFQR